MSHRSNTTFNGGSSHWGDQRGNWRAQVDQLLDEHCTTKSRDGTRATSNRTQAKADFAVITMFEWLRKDLGFKGLSNPNALDERHFRALASHIRERREAGEIGASHAACFATYSRHLARWSGKPELVEAFNSVLGKEVCKRQLTAEHDKSWQAAGIDVSQKLLEILRHEFWVGLVLFAQHHFGLRKTEALMLQPLRDIQPIGVTYSGGAGVPGRSLSPAQLAKLNWKEWVGGVNVFVNDGAKGGRRRVVEGIKADAVEAAYVLRRQILAFGDREKIPPPWKTLQQNAKTYERVLERCGITKKTLVSPPTGCAPVLRVTCSKALASRPPCAAGMASIRIRSTSVSPTSGPPKPWATAG
ncbi:integrase domain-containing protein [Polaromonas sp. P2-4]|nr:integrase domain-containing protein [Polaromonas sp. P2-4]